MRILGIDTGIKNIGWAIIEAERGMDMTLTDVGVFHPKKEDLGQRMLEIYDWAAMLILGQEIAAAGFEETFFFYTDKEKQKKTASKHKQLQAYHTGAILAAIGDLNVKGYRPTDVKHKVAGYAAADKVAVARAVEIRLNRLGQLSGLDDHMTDAIAIAMTRAMDPEFFFVERTR